MCTRRAYRANVSSSAYFWISTYSRGSRHSGHRISVHSLLFKSDLMEVCKQSKHASGGCVHVGVTLSTGKEAGSLVSAQMGHSLEPPRSLAGSLCRVTTTSVVSAAL